MKPYIEIIKIKQTGEYKLKVTFNDRTHREIDFSRGIIKFSGVFKPLKNKKMFSKYKIDMAGGICWDCGADLAADMLHEIKENRFSQTG